MDIPFVKHATGVVFDFSPDAARGFLETVLADEDATLRRAVASRLRTSLDETLHPTLRRFFADPDPAVRTEARLCLLSWLTRSEVLDLFEGGDLTVLGRLAEAYDKNTSRAEGREWSWRGSPKGSPSDGTRLIGIISKRIADGTFTSYYLVNDPYLWGDLLARPAGWDLVLALWNCSLEKRVRFALPPPLPNGTNPIPGSADGGLLPDVEHLRALILSVPGCGQAPPDPTPASQSLDAVHWKIHELFGRGGLRRYHELVPLLIERGYDRQGIVSQSFRSDWYDDHPIELIRFFLADPTAMQAQVPSWLGRFSAPEPLLPAYAEAVEKLAEAEEMDEHRRAEAAEALSRSLLQLETGRSATLAVRLVEIEPGLFRTVTRTLLQWDQEPEAATWSKLVHLGASGADLRTQILARIARAGATSYMEDCLAAARIGIFRTPVPRLTTEITKVPANMSVGPLSLLLAIRRDGLGLEHGIDLDEVRRMLPTLLDQGLAALWSNIPEIMSNPSYGELGLSPNSEPAFYVDDAILKIVLDRLPRYHELDPMAAGNLRSLIFNQLGTRSEVVRESLRKSLREASDGQAWSILSKLSYDKRFGITSLLLRFLESDSLDLSYITLRFLYTDPVPEAFAPVAATVEAAKPLILRQAARTLYVIDPDRAVGVLLDVWKQADADRRREILDMAHWSQDHRFVPIALEVIRSPDGNLATAARNALDGIHYYYEQRRFWSEVGTGAAGSLRGRGRCAAPPDRRGPRPGLAATPGPEIAGCPPRDPLPSRSDRPLLVRERGHRHRGPQGPRRDHAKAGLGR
ncbi:MAG: hypothetical protein R3F30_11665 [Planctomycetota bacterium]